MEVKELHEEMQKTFEEFKKVNDELQEQVETNGTGSAETVEKVEKLNGRLDELETRLARPPVGGGVAAGSELDTEKMASFLKYCRVGKDGLSPDELKDMFVSDNTTGGYLATPPEYIREIIKEIVEFSPVRPLARVRTTSSSTVKIPTRTQSAAAQWVGERGTRSETQNPAYGMEELPVHELSARADISQANLEDSAFNLEEEIRMEFGEQFGVAEGTAFISGDAIGKPEGILTNADVAETNSGNANLLTSDGLIDLFYAVKDAYARNGTWMMKRATIAAVRKLKDGDDQYLWQPGLQGTQPSMLLGRPVAEAVDMPAVSAGLYPVLFGDFRRAYTIVDRVVMAMVRDPFSLSESGLVKFVGRKRVGGQVVLAEAIRKQKVSA